MGDYGGDFTPHAKFKMIAPLGASGRMSEISVSRGFLVLFFVAPKFANA